MQTMPEMLHYWLLMPPAPQPELTLSPCPLTFISNPVKKQSSFYSTFPIGSSSRLSCFWHSHPGNLRSYGLFLPSLSEFKQVKLICFFPNSFSNQPFLLYFYDDELSSWIYFPCLDYMEKSLSSIYSLLCCIFEHLLYAVSARSWR